MFLQVKGRVGVVALDRCACLGHPLDIKEAVYGRGATTTAGRTRAATSSPIQLSIIAGASMQVIQEHYTHLTKDDAYDAMIRVMLAAHLGVAPGKPLLVPGLVFSHIALVLCPVSKYRVTYSSPGPVFGNVP